MRFIHTKPREEKKLAILKDSHIGAFAVIMLAAYGLLFMGAFSQIMDDKAFIVFCAGFFIARCLSGIAVVSFKSAKSDGLLFMFADTAHRTIVGQHYTSSLHCVWLFYLLCHCLMRWP